MRYTHIFWDWNGTLLDDADFCIDATNRSLIKRGLPLVDRQRYYRLFRFPVRDYYVALGFDLEKENYEDLAEEYTDNYLARLDEMPLRAKAKEVLAVFKSKNIKQYILSASERNVLTTSLEKNGISSFFTDVICTDNKLGEGKIEYGKKFASSLPKDSRVLLVGDTCHDLETANAIGADCVLLSNGHSSTEKLVSLGVPVLDDLYELYPIVLGEPVKPGSYSVPLTPSSAERRSFDISEAEGSSFVTAYKAFYDDLKNTNKTEDW